MHRLRWVVWLVPAVLGGMDGSGALAQAVTGRVVAAGSGAAVAGAQVQLLAADGAAGPRMLSRADGSFALLAPAAGRYRLQVDRIGLEPHLSAPIELTVGVGQEVTLAVAARPVSLEGISARGEARGCTILRDGERVSRVWEEARKALQTVALSRSERLVRFDVQLFRRQRDPRTGQVLAEERHSRYDLADNPFHSVSPEELERSGYIQSEADSTVYFGPDAEVLLSDAFLSGHCFRIRDPVAGEAVVGLEFEPVGRVSRPDIAGVMWIDRRTSELRSVEYAYLGHGLDIAEEVAGGTIEFAGVESGAWVVDRWTIRMPLLVEERHRVAVPGGGWNEHRLTRVTAVIERGGEVIGVHAPGARRGGGEGSVQGFVHDSISGGPLAGAVVTVTGTDLQAVTDTAGRFRLEGMDGGRHVLSLSHPMLKALGADSPVREVTVAAGEEAVVILAVPSPRGMVMRHCPMEAEAGSGMLVGSLREAGTGAAVAGARVTVEWREGGGGDGAMVVRSGGSTRLQPVAPGARSRQEVREMGVTTDAAGLYRFCGIPLRTDLILAARLGEVRVRRPLRTGTTPLVVEDLVILPE